MTVPATDASVRMDPWCLVQKGAGVRALFGFAARHADRNGLSWVHSAPIVHHAADESSARTRDGRTYQLGRKLEPSKISAEGEEALVAYSITVRDDSADPAPLCSVTQFDDGLWLAACVIARHLSLPPPPRRSDDVGAFLQEHAFAFSAMKNESEGSQDNDDR